ncbi:MAG: hypothetical protein ACYDCK_10565 [Thermoplasmatota archaeon]
MPSSIQVSERLRKRLAKHKSHPRETYERVIEKALDAMEEDALDFTPAFKKKIARGERELAQGKGMTTAELRRKLGL